VFIRKAVIDDLTSMKDLYKSAFERGDWYGSRTHAEDGDSASSDYLQHYLRDEKAIVVLFHDSRGNVLGSTLLDLSSEDGVLIDDTQIHPVLGRRKGIMSAYFRRLVPVLDDVGCPYWTEFVLTPESRVLRRVLIGELGMRVTGIRPAAYLIRPANDYRSVVVAHGPNRSVTNWLSSVSRLDSHLSDLLACLVDSQSARLETTSQPRVAFQKVQDYREFEIDLDNGDAIANAISDGSLPVGLRPTVSRVYMSQWPWFDLSTLDFLYGEGIGPINNLLTYLRSKLSDVVF
jgi:hypothetical protein